MGGTRQKSQNELTSETDSRGDAPTAVPGGSEPPVAERRDERLALSERLMEEVCERENMLKALKRVKANRGSPGVDGMQTVDLGAYLKEHWPEIREQLLAGT